MPGSAPAPDRTALWAALSHMRIETRGRPRGFETELAEEQGWTRAFAARVVKEYRAFLYLAAGAGFEATPSDIVDRAWHLHLAWGDHYRETLCGRILGRPLEHRPSDGTPEDGARCRGQYEATIALYRRVFGRTPPRDIWPRPWLAEEKQAEGRRSAWRAWAFRAGLGSSASGLAAAALDAPLAAGLLLTCGLLLLLIPKPFPMSGSSAQAHGGCGGACGAGAGGCGGSCGGGGCGGGGCGGGCGGS